MRFSKPKLLLLHYPLSSIDYFENYSQANHKYLNVYVWMITPAHASIKTKKEKPKKFLST